MTSAAPQLLPTATGARCRAALRELLRAHRGPAVTAFLLLLAASAIGLLTAPLLGHIVDIVATGRPVTDLNIPVALLAAVAVGQGAVLALGIARLARAGEGMLATLRERFVAHALSLPQQQLERAGSGDLTSRVTSDVTVIATAVREALPHLGRSVLTIALTMVGLAVLDWRFLIAAVLAIPVQAYTVRWYVRRALPLYARHRIAVGAQQQQLLSTISGARTVRAFRAGERHVDRVRQRSNAAVELALRAIRLLTGFYGKLNLAEFIGLSAVLTAGFVLVGNGAATIGTATAAALYFHSLFNPINAALALVDDAQAAGASFARLIGVCDLPSEPVGTVRVPVDASVKVAGLCHAYRPGHQVLDQVSLQLDAGERIALVGASGAGKTTLAGLIAGIHQPSKGSIALGGVDIEELGPAGARRATALISQEVHVFAGTLAEDLRLAKPDASDDELLRALERVGAAGWATGLPGGLSTVVGDGGHRLTVAQAQQLALARLVLADPPIAILDEATAEAGSTGARALERSADHALSGRTSMIVAHRLTQAASADRIVVLDGGRVVENGSHDELVAAGGAYARLWQAWRGARG